MPEESLRKATPPPSGRMPSAKAKGPVPTTDVEEVVASTEPDDNLEDYIVPPDPEPEVVADPAPVVPTNRIEADGVVSGKLAHNPDARPSAGPVTTADTELVHRLQAELAAAVARLEGQEADVSTWSAGSPPPAPADGDQILIHVREDGFTANGRVWYRGQELEFTVGAPNWKATCDRSGQSWLLLDDAAQIRRWGQVMFGHGPWPGLPFDNTRAAEAERRRGREAPTIPQLSSQKQLRT